MLPTQCYSLALSKLTRLNQPDRLKESRQLFLIQPALCTDTAAPYSLPVQQILIFWVMLLKESISLI